MRTNGKIHIIFGLLLLLLLPVGLWGEEVAPRSLSASSEAAGELVSPVVAVDSFQAELPISPPPTPSPQAGRGSSNASQVASVVRLPTSRDNTSDRTSITAGETNASPVVAVDSFQTEPPKSAGGLEAPVEYVAKDSIVLLGTGIAFLHG